MTHRTMCLVVVTLIFIIKQSASEETERLQRQRQRILHHRYPQVFRNNPSSARDEARRRGGYRPYPHRRPSGDFELPDETHHPWVPEQKMPHNRRPADSYGSPPVSWPMRPNQGREQPAPHDMYGPPVDMSDTMNDDVHESGFRADYEYEQYPEDQFQRVQEKKGAQQKSAMQKSASYIGGEMQQKLPRDDKIENFEIPLELLRIPQSS